MAGGASFAPSRWSLPGEAIIALIKSACSLTAFIVLMRNVRKRRFDFGVLPGESRFSFVLVSKDQLLCFPDPLTPL